MPLVSLVELENSLKMNHFINQHHPQFNNQHHHHHHQHHQQQHAVNQHGGHSSAGVQSPAYFNPASSTNMNAANLSNNSNNLIANEIINQIQNMNAMNLNSKLLTNITNNLMMNGIKPSTASSILSGINLNALSQSIQNKHVNYSRYKTELCRQFSENGECKYGDKCQFAHGFNDLKDVNRHPKYKTDFCKTFHSKGFCPYGPRCHFIHDLSEKFDMSILNVSSSGSPQTSASQAAHDSMIISKYLNGLNNKTHHSAHTDFGKDTLIDKELEAIQKQITSSLFSNTNEDLNDEDRGDEKKAVMNDGFKQEPKCTETKTDKEPILTPQSSLDELEVSLTQSLSLLSYAQSPSMSSSSASSSNCISSAASSHASSSGSSKSSSPVSSSSNNIIGESNSAPAYVMSLKSSSEPAIGNQANMFASGADLRKNDPLSILLLSSPSPSSSSLSSGSSSRSSASSSNENVFQSSNLYFNNSLSDMNLLSKARLQSPAKPVSSKPNSLKTAQSFDKWTSLSGETNIINDSSLLAINAASNLDPTALSPSMIQFLRQHQQQQQQQPQSNVIKRPGAMIGQETVPAMGMTPPPIGSHLSKTTQSGGKMDNPSYFNNPNKISLNPPAKFNINW